jgi:hypothetical protein
VDQQFKDFTIADLREHQQAILNMFYQFNNVEVNPDELMKDFNMQSQD